MYKYVCYFIFFVTATVLLQNCTRDVFKEWNQSLNNRCRIQPLLISQKLLLGKSKETILSNLGAADLTYIQDNILAWYCGYSQTTGKFLAVQFSNNTAISNWVYDQFLKRRFDLIQWQANKETRYEMVDDLIRTELSGMKTLTELTQALGVPEKLQKSDWYYYLGFGYHSSGNIEPDYLRLRFSNEQLISYGVIAK